MPYVHMGSILILFFKLLTVSLIDNVITDCDKHDQWIFYVFKVLNYPVSDLVARDPLTYSAPSCRVQKYRGTSENSRMCEIRNIKTADTHISYIQGTRFLITYAKVMLQKESIQAKTTEKKQLWNNRDSRERKSLRLGTVVMVLHSAEERMEYTSLPTSL